MPAVAAKEMVIWLKNAISLLAKEEWSQITWKMIETRAESFFPLASKDGCMKWFSIDTRDSAEHKKKGDN